ncbi:PAS domain-containing sensor histidine kinase [Candidatus Methylospira mobilis]|nr:PAS domain S-box protein [Candidatus Methylospira mobilis]
MTAQSGSSPELKFRESEDIFHLITENMDDLIMVLDTEGLPVYKSPSYRRVLGDLSDESAVSLDHVHPDDRARIKSIFQKVIASGQGQRTEYRYLFRSGEIRHMESQSSVIRDENGRIRNILIVARDISERKRAEDEFRLLNQELESRIRARTEQIRHQRDVLVELAHLDKSDFRHALTKILGAAATALNVERVSFWRLAGNKSRIECEQLFLNSRGEPDPEAAGIILLKQDFPDYFAAILQQQTLIADDARTHPATRAFTPSYLTPYAIFSMLDVAVWFRGNIVGILCHEQVGDARLWTPEEVDFASSIATMLALALEASSRAQAETERAVILENSEIGISLHKDRRMMWANRKMEELFGFDRNERVGLTAESQFATPESFDEVGKLAYPMLAQGLVFRREYEMLRKDGTKFWCQISGKAIDPDDLSKGSIWTSEDISERIRQEREIRNALEKERQLNELKNRFVSMTSHEFRTPLSTILSSTELLQHYHDRLPAEERGEILNSIQTAVKRMTAMLDEILIIGKADAGRMEFNPQPMELSTFCNRLLEEFRRAAPGNIRFAYSPPLCREVCMDEKLLRHILSNLLSNAIKYSPHGGTVSFGAACNADAVVFKICDQGIGIPEEDLPHLFESFHRAGNVGNISGTGLGLSIVKRSVERHGGDIEIESRLGLNTTFLVTIPLQQT